MKSGIASGYLPDGFNPNEDTSTDGLRKIVEAYGRHNRGFDARAALRAIADGKPDNEAERGDMFNAIAAGLGIHYDPDDPFDVADELADMGILKGHDRDGDGRANPYIRPDADPDTTMTNHQLAAFLSRIPTDAGADDRRRTGSRPTANRPPRGGGDPPGVDGDPPAGGNPPPSGGDGPEDETCTTGLGLSNRQRALLLAQLKWTTLVDIKPQGEPGRPWPPHPDVPGGTEYLLVAGSPVWPLADPRGMWHVVSDDGCLWEAVSIQTRLTELLPWSTGHRAAIENADSARPGAGFDTYLSRWDSLSATQQAQARQHHTNRDVSASCGIETAKSSEDSRNGCRWELPAPGVWSWQARACFRGVAEGATFHECDSLARGVEWFLEIIDYTSGITLQHDSAVTPGAGPRRPAPDA